MNYTCLRKNSRRYNVLKRVVTFLVFMCSFTILAMWLFKRTEAFWLGVILFSITSIFVYKLLKVRKSFRTILRYIIDCTVEGYLRFKGVYKYGFKVKERNSKYEINIYDDLGQGMNHLRQHLSKIFAYTNVRCNININQKNMEDLIDEIFAM